MSRDRDQRELPGLREDAVRWMRERLGDQRDVRDESLNAMLDCFPDRAEALEAWLVVAGGHTYRGSG